MDIHITYHILDIVQKKKTRFTMAQPYMVPIVLSIQFLLMACDLRSQGISRHGIDKISRNIPSLASEELIASQTKCLIGPCEIWY